MRIVKPAASKNSAVALSFLRTLALKPPDVYREQLKDLPVKSTLETLLCAERILPPDEKPASNLEECVRFAPEWAADASELEIVNNKDLDAETMDWLIDVTRANMRPVYDRIRAGNTPWSDNYKLAQFRQPSHFVIARDATTKKKLGFAQVRFDRRANFAAIDELSIESKHQGLGLGSKFMDFIEDWVRRLGFTTLRLMVQISNPGAIRLYHRRGYRIIAEPQAADGAVIDASLNLCKFLNQTSV
ncbi:MAG: uncharacterized protein KVP18_003832 [Porospora cf. gigantea A]|uniref:uncharacterized protein n=1 Tax=Porospora cf. gigantea A TaxID=2853593 RepID=UPI0035597C11|nr:MAG: hypothetical protein KVP18_003832 [Porospora cf. gigantea A]